jgi:glycosyltransferase involved in cell wall biosynthesis
VIAGNDDSDHLPVLERKIAELRLSGQVELVGPLFGDAKEQAYLNGDLFVLLSYSKNFGIVVPEALGYEMPVLTATGCPWQELVTEKCGWWVGPTPEGIDQSGLICIGTRALRYGRMWTGVSATSISLDRDCQRYGSILPLASWPRLEAIIFCLK